MGLVTWFKEITKKPHFFDGNGNTFSLQLGTPLIIGEKIPKGHIGKIETEALPDEKGYVELKGIRVESNFRGKGLGEVLLKNQLEQLNKKGIAGIKSIYLL